MRRMVSATGFLLLIAGMAGAQTMQVLHSFSGTDGSHPYGLISDAAGNFYGVALTGGGAQNCCGTVFELSPSGTGYKTTVLHRFAGGRDGSNPIGNLLLDAEGNLFGITAQGGVTAKSCENTCGTVFELSPKIGGGWTYAQIYRFLGVGAGDGAEPYAGLIEDASGNLYGTTRIGGKLVAPKYCGATGCGTVFELSPGAGTWTETVLYKFAGDLDGNYPESPVAFDANGNLDGATSQGGGGPCSTGPYGLGCGTIFQMVPSSGTWTENVLYRFQGSDGNIPFDALIFDAAGNLYGAANLGGANGDGSIFQLTQGSGGTWTETTLFSYSSNEDGADPGGGVTMDSSGNIYGTSFEAGAHDAGTVIELTPASGGGYTSSLIFSFSGRGGSGPDGNLLLDASGNIYGTVGYGGAKGDGLVFKITP
jgi:uncharacterized repeat protein (TIGR03803 family)